MDSNTWWFTSIHRGDHGGYGIGAVGLLLKTFRPEDSFPLSNSAGHTCSPQSNEWHRGPTERVRHSAYRGNPHGGASALQVIYLIWFGYVAHLSQWEGRGSFILFIWRLPFFAAPRGRRGRSQHPVLYNVQYRVYNVHPKLSPGPVVIKKTMSP